MGNRISQILVAWLLGVVAVLATAAIFPSAQGWLQSLATWRHPDESAVATPGQAMSDAAAAANRNGNAALRAGDNAKAVSDYLQGEAADPKFVWNYVALGGLYALLNRLADADEQLQHAVILEPGTQFLHYDLATVELREGRYAAARRDFNIEARISPEYQPAIEGRRQAMAALRAGRRVAAAPLVPVAVPTAAPSRSLTPAATQAPTPTPPPTRPASARQSAPAVRSARAARSASSSRRLALASVIPRPAPQTYTAPLPVSNSAVTEARTYLLDISQDLNFTQALPAADPSATTPQLRKKLQALIRSPRGSEDELLRVGASALLSGRLSLAATAFSAAADRARNDWRGPYLAGLTAFASGDGQGARALFETANARVARPEAYTSLAIVDLQRGDDDAAAADAERAASLDPSYGPGRFTAGMLALVRKDAAAAWQQLSAASNLSGVPARLDHFLSLVSPR